MKLRTIVFLFLVVCALFLPTTSAENPYLDPMVTTYERVAEKTFNGFTTSWYYNPGLTTQEYIIAVQNHEGVNRETNITSLISNTNFNLYEISNIFFEEYKLIPYTYTVDHYDEVEHSEWDPTNQTWVYWTESIFNYTETIEDEKLDWKPCKMNTFSLNSAKLKENYGYMLIPKYNSKDKGDGTFNGTKIFKLTFDTPVTNTQNGFGSVGRIALLLDEVEFCPYWNTSWLVYSTVTTNTTAPEDEFQIHFTNTTFTIPLVMWNEMNLDGNDTRILNYNHTIEFPFWIEHLTARDNYSIWVNVTDNASAVYQWYYGNPSASSVSDGYTVFETFSNTADDWTGGSEVNLNERIRLLDSSSSAIFFILPSTYNYNQIVELKYFATQTTGLLSQQFLRMSMWEDSSNRFATHEMYQGASYMGYDGATPTIYWNSAPMDTDLVAKTFLRKSDAKVDYYMHQGDIEQGSDLNNAYSLGSPTTMANLYFWAGSTDAYCDIRVDWVFVRKYTANEPIVSDISEPHFYVNSLHYNATIPYNFTIESDGTLTSNRSIIPADDTNDTTQSTGTSYLQINVFNNSAAIVRNFTITGDNLDWYQVANISGTYALKNSTGTIETQSNGNFTTNLTAGTYWIEKTGISISLVSFTPSPVYTNYTGATVISYIVQSQNPLNLSTLAFLYGLNYTITGDMHNYVGVPPCDIGYEGIYRAPNRNVTPYLSWEFNDTITGGNVWQWGGGDNDSWWISKTPINATHTYINATGITQHILPSSFYLKKTAMYSAPKTGFEINRLQGIIIKIWNVEEIRTRNANYFANMYFDTSWEGTLPTYPVEVGFCNFSYDPTVDDIDTSPNCTKFGEWDGNRWVNHSWVPGPNASYAYPFVVNASQFTEPTPTDINYIWLRSNTISSKSYILNATDYDPGITNITFAETNTMWTYNELNGVTSPVAYTPSFFTTFVRDYEELLHHLYIADDTGTWGHSDIFNETIGLSSVSVLPVSFEHFNVTCQGDYIEDSLMDATYDEGSIFVNIHCPADPDGGTVSHNLTLHYAANQTLVAVINDTFTTTGAEYVDINFTTTPYYSSSDFYTLRCVSTDDENDVATKWLISDFTLDADGNQGWVVDDKVSFWGMNDIPTLYATVANNSLISYNAGSDIYTMHVPFFKSKSNDTFYFNETVHLKSLNDENVAYFRHSGETIFDYATIHAWNTTTDIAAPITDEYRGYVFSHFHVCGNITNSDFSYLGSDFYRQEGLNFIGNPHDYLIYNTTFLHNAEGPVMEYCSNMNISQCTITDNVNVGIGMYFTNDTTANNNTISSNGGRGISIYDGHNNIINYNEIIGSGVHGIHLWSNSCNNTATANDISGSAQYDYYLSSSSLGNYIIDPASTTDRIRVTSTSSLNIENTDNAAFSEDSLNTSYAYLTNFSMYISGASQTFDITQRDMTILPSTDKVAIWNFEWGPTIVFDITSETEINPTWFNITNDAWLNKDIYIYKNDDKYTTELATESGKITFNYSENLINIRFRFTSETPAWDTLINSIAWAISIAQFLVANIGVVIVTAFSLTCILILMILIGMALSVTNIIYR